MSSEKDLVSKKGKFTLQRTFGRGPNPIRSHLWRQETPKRSASRSKLSVDKKIKKVDRGRLRLNFRALRKTPLPIRRPSPPHNTTQYIIYAHSSCEEAPNTYFDHDRFKYDFNHHAMAGSMMSLMMNKPTDMNSQSPSKPSTQDTEGLVQGLDHKGQEQGIVVRVQQDVYGSCSRREESERLVNPVNSGLDTDYCFNIADRDEKDDDPYSHYLRKAETGRDLQRLIQELVNVLDQKEQQINFLKSHAQPNAVLSMDKRTLDTVQEVLIEEDSL